MIISIFASIGSQNLGDELILKNEIQAFEKIYGKDTKFVVFSYDIKNPFFKKKNIKYVEYFPVGIKKIRNIFKNIFNFFIFIKIVIYSDLIVVGGGGIIYDNEKQTTVNPLSSWIFRTNIFRILRKKVYFYALGLNIKDKNNLFKIKKIFSKAFKITIRDSYSFNLLKQLNIKSEIVKDPVFNELEKQNIQSFLIKKVMSDKFGVSDLEDIDMEGKKVALALRKGYINTDEKKEKQQIINIIDYLLEKKARIILLPHSFHKNDKLVNDELFLKQFLRVNSNIRIINSMEEVYTSYIYKEFDICLAMRLHSIILSQVYSIPFIGISYSIKTDEILNEIGSKNI